MDVPINDLELHLELLLLLELLLRTHFGGHFAGFVFQLKTGIMS